MKRLVLILTLILSVLLICGCSDNDFSTISTSNTQDEKRIIFYEQQGNITDNHTLDTVLVYMNNREQIKHTSAVFLEVASEENVLTYDLGCWDYRVLKHGNMSLADIDQDGMDEIILCMEVTGNGGVLAQIFRVQENKILLFADLKQLEFDIEESYNVNYTMVLKNTAVDFSQTIDISDQFAPEYFDAEGRFIGTWTTLRHNINAVTVEDSGRNEYPKIICEQDIQLSSYLGILKTSFRFDPELQLLVLDGIYYETGQEDSALASSGTDPIDPN